MPILLYDGDCGFCRFWVEWIRARTGPSVHYEPYQSAGSRFPQIAPEQFAQAVHFVDENGGIHRGAAAIFRALTFARGLGYWWKLYESFPLFAPISEAVYRVIAGKRVLFSKLTRAFLGRDTMPGTHGLVTNLYLRAIGLIYLVAFLSFAVQLRGLIGERGILPATEFLATVADRYGPEAYSIFPTLAWLHPADSTYLAIAWGGAAAGLALVVGAVPLLGAVAAWACFLSLVNIGNVFLGYQWEALLLEAGFLAIFLAPRKLFQGFHSTASPPMTLIWLHRWLLFRLVFSSGVAKWASGDPSWNSFTAMAYHFETQPLPTPLAWYLHQLPQWTLKAMSAGTFVMEVLVPLLFFLPRRARKLGCYAQILFQAMLMASGNFAYFNLLTIALCLLLLEDKDVRRFFPRGTPLAVERRPLSFAMAVLAVLIVSLSALRTQWLPLPGLLRDIVSYTDRFQIVSGYGLFVSMTTHRDELEIEGSDDQKTWKAYRFRWKPQDVGGRPRFIAPHQPRVDWQMWFAALSSFERELWLQRLCLRLLEGEPAVTRLLADNPFGTKPPKFLRIQRYRYVFSRGGQDWWDRKLLGAYSPVISLPK